LSPVPTPGLNILIAEDNAAGAASLAHYLRLAGHTPRTAPDGGAAVKAALEDPPDAALLDIGLPGLDGWEVARAIRRALGVRACLIFALTGLDDEPDRNRSREAGINLHLRKPAEPELLTALLAKYGRAAHLCPEL
jgi:DNA-binding response OmpR family regulator